MKMSKLKRCDRGFRCYRMWCHVIGQLLPNILKDHSAFSIRQ